MFFKQSHNECGISRCIYLLFAVRDVADATPRKGLVRVEFAVGAVDVKPLSIHSK